MILDGHYNARVAARAMYEKLTDKGGNDKKRSRKKVSTILGIKFRNKKLE